MFLHGIWRLERSLDDRRAGQRGSLNGEAVFTEQGGDLLYREAGHLSIGGHAHPVYEGPALQSYRYAFPASARAAVHFRDGRFFHDLDLTGGAWGCVHLCGPDRYEGAFTVLDADTWRVVWRVTGPRKDLILDSSYRRAL
ncbi:DUF6314 family protein [Pelagibius sp. 7325]|uniref:DUF6314 family protein n=1 Tax=Pelagibius sp. 7325 TaxID=3131994 RepID=UPI0030EF3349